LDPFQDCLDVFDALDHSEVNHKAQFVKSNLLGFLTELVLEEVCVALFIVLFDYRVFEDVHALVLLEDLLDLVGDSQILLLLWDAFSIGDHVDLDDFHEDARSPLGEDLLDHLAARGLLYMPGLDELLIAFLDRISK